MDMKTIVLGTQPLNEVVRRMCEEMVDRYRACVIVAIIPEEYRQRPLGYGKQHITSDEFYEFVSRVHEQANASFIATALDSGHYGIGLVEQSENESQSILVWQICGSIVAIGVTEPKVVTFSRLVMWIKLKMSIIMKEVEEPSHKPMELVASLF